MPRAMCLMVGLIGVATASRAWPADCPGKLVLDWVGTNGAPGGRENDEAQQRSIALDVNGECGVAGYIVEYCDVDPTDGVELAGPVGLRDVLINLVDPLAHSQNLRVGAEGLDQCLAIASPPSGGWYYAGETVIDGSYEYCVDFNPFPDEDDTHCFQLSAYNEGSFVTFIDSRGRYRWTRVLADPRGDIFVWSIAPTPEGGVVLAGLVEGTIDLGYGTISTPFGRPDVLLASMDQNGDFNGW